jgi:hypothetical protein
VANNNPLTILTIWEIVRLWAGGKEYREKRVPELVADIVASAQDDNAVAGVLSDWFRHHFVNENQTALMFTVARFLRSRGGRTLDIVAETLEALPDISEEMRRRPEMQSGTPEERRAHLKEAMATAVAEKYEEIKARLPTLNTNGGPVADINIPSIASGVTMGIASFLTGTRGVMGAISSVVMNAALKVAQVSIAGVAVAALYLYFLVDVAWNDQEQASAFAWSSFQWLIAIPMIGMLIGLFLGKTGAAIQGLSIATLTLLSSTLIMIAFAAAVVCGFILDNDNYGDIVILMIIATVWDYVCIGIAQKAFSTVKFFTKWVPRFFNDFTIDKEEAEQLAQHWERSNTLTTIGVSIAGAVNLGTMVITMLKMMHSPLSFRVGFALIALQIVLGAVYVFKGLKLYREDEFKAFMKLPVMQWASRFYTSAQTSRLLIPIVVILMFLGTILLTKERAERWATNTREAAFVSVEETLPFLGKPPQAITGTKAEDIVREEESEDKESAVVAPKRARKSSESWATMNCGGEVISAAKVKARKASLGGKPLKGTEHAYPWNCR